MTESVHAWHPGSKEGPLILIKGAGDIGTGVAHRLYRAGFGIIMTELPEPRAVRRTVAFSDCVFEGTTSVEEVTAVRLSIEQALRMLAKGLVSNGPIPLVIDPDGTASSEVPATLLIDARMAKRNLGTKINDADVVIGLGPGFTAGLDVHAVVETARGHSLGQVIYRGCAREFTGVPGEIGGFTVERVLRAPTDGTLRALAGIGTSVVTGQSVAEIAAGAERVPIKAAIPGILRGLLRDGAPVSGGQKIGDVDPRCEPDTAWRISDKARSVAGGVLEAVMCLLWGRPPVDQTDAGGATGEKGRDQT